MMTMMTKILVDNYLFFVRAVCSTIFFYHHGLYIRMYMVFSLQKSRCVSLYFHLMVKTIYWFDECVYSRYSYCINNAQQSRAPVCVLIMSTVQSSFLAYGWVSVCVCLCVYRRKVLLMLIDGVVFDVLESHYFTIVVVLKVLAKQFCLHFDLSELKCCIFFALSSFLQISRMGFLVPNIKYSSISLRNPHHMQAALHDDVLFHKKCTALAFTILICYFRIRCELFTN